MSDNRNDRLEGEEIQKGLEQFLDQELYGAEKTPSVKTRADELDLSLAEPMIKKTEYRTADADRAQGYSAGGSMQRRTTESGSAQRHTTSGGSTQRRTTESGSVQRHTASGDGTRRHTSGGSSAQRRTTDDDGMRRHTTSGGSTQRRTSGSGSGARRMTGADDDRTQSPQKKGAKKSTERVQREMGSKKRGSKKRDKGKKKKNRLAKILLVLAAILCICFFALYLLVGNVYQKMTYQEAESFTTEPMKEDGVINVLLIGNDSRLNGEDGRSDAMILVSISDKTKTITMTSLLRDMYVEIPGYENNRLNAAYSFGGPDLLMRTIEQNFDIPVHRYALVNFQAFANLVDAVGGVDLELTNDEVQYVNGYLMEYNQLLGQDLATDFLDPSLSGEIHLNGPQALAYSRNRYIGTDFGRTERQRKVLSAVIGKLPGAVMTNSGELIDGLFPNLTTNLKQGECFSLTLNAWKFLGYDMVQQCVPIEGSYSDATIRDMAVLQVDFEANKQFLKSSIYGE